MTAAIPITEPKIFTAGDLISWNKSLSNYPATDWTLTYVFLNATDKFTLGEDEITADGDAYAIVIDSETSVTYKSGIYNWQAYVTDTDENRVSVASGKLEIKPNLATMATYDGRSQARITLEAIQATVLRSATKGQLEYTIGNRTLKSMTLGELIQAENNYKAIVAAEEASDNLTKGLGTKNRIYTRI